MNIKYKDGADFLCPRCKDGNFTQGGGCIVCTSCKAIISNQYLEIAAEDKEKPKEKIEEKKETK